MSKIREILGKSKKEKDANIGKENKSEQSDATQQEKRENAAPATEDTGTKTKRKAHVYNLIIVDESGSMCTLKEFTMSGVNETISTIRKAQEEFRDTQQHTLTLVTFDSEGDRPPVRTIIENQPIDSVGPFTDYSPFGCTPLYDAMGQSLSRLHNQVKDDADASVVVTVMTDGLENASTEWNAFSLRKLIEQLKEEGWVFSYMGSEHDVEAVTRNLSIDNFVEFSHDDRGAENTWGRESASRREYYRHMKELYGAPVAYSATEMKERKRQYSRNYYSERVTPEHITTLKDNEVFVFGSNVDGMHAGGAAAFALSYFGAVWGQGEGLQGKSYAIPTMEGIESMKKAINRFIDFAKENPDTRFLVTPIGCGIAGYSPKVVAPLFKVCLWLENVSLPRTFWNALGLRM